MIEPFGEPLNVCQFPFMGDKIDPTDFFSIISKIKISIKTDKSVNLSNNYNLN